MALFRCELAGYKSDWLLLKFQPVCGGGYKKTSIVFLISNEEKYKLCYGLQKKSSRNSYDLLLVMLSEGEKPGWGST